LILSQRAAISAPALRYHRTMLDDADKEAPTAASKRISTAR
jgi:hypothetical protein